MPAKDFDLTNPLVIVRLMAGLFYLPHVLFKTCSSIRKPFGVQSGAAFTDEARSTTAKVRLHNAGDLACQLDSGQPGCREVRVPAFALVVALDTAARNVTRNRNCCRDANEQSG